MDFYSIETSSKTNQSSIDAGYLNARCLGLVFAMLDKNTSVFLP